ENNQHEIDEITTTDQSDDEINTPNVAEEEKKYNQYPTKPVIREKMSRRKKTAAKKLLEESNNTAMLTTFNEVDMTNVMELRKRKKEQIMKDHLTFEDIGETRDDAVVEAYDKVARTTGINYPSGPQVDRL
ncbi:2-oxo acid dehydrogenase subunit E2, partial [Staphylococcus aureus]|uniref:2-oxo acid dehydrogenase subunit E2 n=1 Tax=Staphylococcus aureus TaxID=1280 RepID=UPI00210BE04E